MNKLSVVIPCYNEEEILQYSINKISEYLNRLQKEKLFESYQLILVDDGSKDNTWDIILSLSENYVIKGIKLSRNEGHQNALVAGLFNNDGDIMISIDADLQDDITVIKEMINKYFQGCDIVYGVRRKRDSDTFFKRVSAESFYKLMKLFGVDLVYNHADFRLMSKRAINDLKEFKEVNLFLRGIVPLIGYKSDKVYYDRSERIAGKSKFPLKKMLSFAWQGITSFSTVPLKLISMIGFLVFIFSIIMGLWVLWEKIFTDNALPGWASIVLPIYFIGGIQLLALGVIGEYIGKIYQESKQRPRYFISKMT